jgi:hypothetical protein
MLDLHPGDAAWREPKNQLVFAIEQMGVSLDGGLTTAIDANIATKSAIARLSKLESTAVKLLLTSRNPLKARAEMAGMIATKLATVGASLGRDIVVRSTPIQQGCSRWQIVATKPAMVRGSLWLEGCLRIDPDPATVFKAEDISNETRDGSFVVVVARAFLENQWTPVQQRNPQLPSRPLCRPFEAQRDCSRFHLPRSLDVPAGLMFSQPPSAREKKQSASRHMLVWKLVRPLQPCLELQCSGRRYRVL